MVEIDTHAADGSDETGPEEAGSGTERESATGFTGSASRRRNDWRAIYAGWQRGRSPEQLADQFELDVKTIRGRCAWLDHHFPPADPVRVFASIGRSLEAANTLLDSGQPLEAERYARAAQALMRAARAMEDWSVERETSNPQTGPGPDAEIDPDYDPRAELESRLRRLLDFERKRRDRRSGEEAGIRGEGAERGGGRPDMDGSGPQSP